MSEVRKTEPPKTEPPKTESLIDSPHPIYWSYYVIVCLILSILVCVKKGKHWYFWVVTWFINRSHSFRPDICSEIDKQAIWEKDYIFNYIHAKVS